MQGLPQLKQISIKDYAAAGAATAVQPTPARDRASAGNSWYMAMTRAWGETLDKQAGKIETLSDAISSQGEDTPSVMVQLTAEAQRMGFMSSNASTSNNSVAQALETLAKKQ
ncbi:hypothetical protein ABWL39_10365 [Chitinivorax sp. PXF-14]|uniref:hypothetical protein n=1 Tax=Chitinivorax sp. PXF-14 TaxID=3230488 RepID=UPI0034667870